MMSCKKSTELMSQQQDRKLSAYETMALRFHLAMCRGCTNFQRNMGFLRAACKRAGESKPE
jgi:hypothetical protein